MREMVGGCCVCSDDRGWPENPLVYCDGQSCTVAVHQACYGIVTVPTGPWYCRKCESQERSAKVKCELCPSKYGALKRTDNSGWAHVVCALYIPEVRFGNVTTMEPIQLQLIPQERFSKVCYICGDAGKPANASVGACMQCNKSGCKQQFHVTCAQGLGLLCEEAGNYLDNVKYCGYCQHHYSKLKKGGNVKTIPPYKPVSNENHQSDSNSEKEIDANLKAPTSTVGKRKSSSTTKASSASTSKSTTPSAKSSSSYQKTVQNNNKSNEKNNKNTSVNKSAKNNTDDTNTAPISSVTTFLADHTSDKTDKKDLAETDKDIIKEVVKEVGKGKKRKATSRTPTPNIVSESVLPVTSVVITTTATTTNSVNESATVSTVTSSASKKETVSTSEIADKPKKAKTEPAPPTTSAAPQTTALTTTTTTTTTTAASVVKSTTASTTSAAKTPLETTAAITATTATITPITHITPSIIQSTPTTTINSIVVSVPLVNTTLSPRSSGNQTIAPTLSIISSTTTTPSTSTHQSVDKKVPISINNGNTLTSTSSKSHSHHTATMITSEMSGGGLKITFEKQAPPSSSLQAELERINAPAAELPIKRLRSQSSEKVEKPARSKKRNANGVATQLSTAAVTSKRASRSQHSTPPPQATSFVNMPQNSQIKDSPPSSPSSESLGAPPTTGRKTKGRKSAPASVSSSSGSNHKVDTKENINLFQNGIHAPHMLGNQLNPNSNMAQKMSDHLNSELEAHSIFSGSTADNSSNLVGPQLHHRVIASARSSSAGGSSTASGGSGLSSMLGGGGGVIPQTLDQLLERQWEQGSQFLMEQAQHFDIASLLSCLHQLRAENLRLEEHVSSLLQRRDHLLAVNARLAIPLTGPPATPQSSHPHTVNNIHPAVATSHAEAPRSRHSGGYPPHAQSAPQHPPGNLENGLPSDQGYPPHPHRSPAGQPQPSPSQTVRQSSSGYGSGLLRQNPDSSGRSAPRPHGYQMYPGPSSSQQQMVIRRDPDIHHQSSSSSKPS